MQIYAAPRVGFIAPLVYTQFIDFNFVPMMVPDCSSKYLSPIALDLFLIVIDFGSPRRKDLLFSIFLEDADFFNVLMLTTAIIHDITVSKSLSQATFYYKTLVL